MNYDEDKVDRVVLALLLLGQHSGQRAWKSHDWDALGRLHEKGWISNPIGKEKSVVITDSGLRKAEECWGELFGERDGA